MKISSIWISESLQLTSQDLPYDVSSAAIRCFMEKIGASPSMDLPDVNVWLPKQPQIEHVKTSFENLFINLQRQMIRHGDRRQRYVGKHLTSGDISVYIGNGDCENGVDLNLLADYEVTAPMRNRTDGTIRDKLLGNVIYPQELIIDSMNDLESLDRYILGTEIIRTYMAHFSEMFHEWKAGNLSNDDYYRCTFTYPDKYDKVIEDSRILYKKILDGNLEPWNCG